MSEKSPIVPMLGGAGGAIIAVVGADKLGIDPRYAAWGTAAAGALTALGTKGVVRQIATGVGAAGMCLGALQLVGSAKVEAAKREHATKKRQADGPYVTRTELNDALSHLADGQKQAHCDLLTALRDEVKRIVTETSKPAPTPSGGVPRMYPLYPVPRDAEEEYPRNADEERNAEDSYERNAYGDEERNADEERNDDGERNAEEYAATA